MFDNRNSLSKTTSPFAIKRTNESHEQASFTENSNNQSNTNSNTSTPALNKSDLYSHRINVLKNMNRHYTTQTLSKLLTESEHNQNSHDLFNNDDDQTTSADPEFYENGNQLVEDIYDFRGLKPSLLLDSSSNNPTDDEDDDINFDYGYGYDYEKVIKDRLKIANQEFNNQPVENKRKPILVSFDNAVTAIDITEGAETPTPTAKSVAEKNNVNISTTTPLTTTTTTTKHANFADNIEKKKITFGYATQNNNNNNLTSNHTNHETVVKLPLNDTVEKENPNEFSDKIKEAVLRYDLEMEKLNNLEKERMHNNNNNNEVGGGNSLLAVEQNNGKAGNRTPPTNGGSGSKSTSSLSNSSKSSIQSPSNSASPDLTDNSNKNSMKLSAKENVVDVDEIDDLTEPVKRAKEPEKKFQFKAAKSPSPISDNNLGGKISPDSKESKSNDNSMSINNATITTAITATTLLNNSNDEFMTNNHHQGSSNKEEKMLIEKDGKFRLLSAEEYMAEERKRQIEQKAAAKNQNKQNKRTIKPRIPQPPTRPKTSTEPRSSLRNQFLQNNGRANQSADRSKNSSTMSTNSKNDSNNSSNSNNVNSNQAQRLSHSADFLYRKKETSKRPEVRKKRLEEEERKREENERAFRKWIELKQKEAQEKSSKKMDEDKNNNKKMSSVDAETREKALQEWLERKRQQEEKDKEYNRKLEQFLAETRHTATVEERSKAFKEWVNRKLREKNEEARLERLEHKKWMARRRKSRKHQRLSQALEMAQAYGYSNTHYFPGFNF